MALEIQIATGSPVPVYRQIIDSVQRGVLSGRFVAGHQLPSVRALAERLVINPNTVSRAYQALVQDGFVESQQGKGYFVARRRQVYTKAEQRRRLGKAVDAFVSEVGFLDLPRSEVISAVEKLLTKYEEVKRQAGGRP